MFNKYKWNIIKEVGEPKETNRFLIVYKYREMTRVRYYIGDYDINFGWNCLLKDIEIIAWRNIPVFEFENNSER